jgi:hypothetical protein
VSTPVKKPKGNPDTQATLDTRHRVKTNKAIKHNTVNRKVE